jgi:hypothetical protein
VADLPFVPADAGSTQRLLRAVDAEGKIPRALEAHGPFAGRDVVLFGASPERARWLTEAGARLSVVADPATEPAWPPDSSADIAVAFWAAFDGPDRAASLARAELLLRPAGQLLVVLDYGRDDLDVVRGLEATADLVAWSRPNGWFLSRGFRVRVVHAFWQFDSIEEGGELLRAAYGPAAEPAITRLRRPRLAHNVAVYRWTRENAALDAAAPGAAARSVAVPRRSRDAAGSKRRAPTKPGPTSQAGPAPDPAA